MFQTKCNMCYFLMIPIYYIRMKLLRISSTKVTSNWHIVMHKPNFIVFSKSKRSSIRRINNNQIELTGYVRIFTKLYRQSFNLEETYKLYFCQINLIHISLLPTLTIAVRNEEIHTKRINSAYSCYQKKLLKNFYREWIFSQYVWKIKPLFVSLQSL